jgi:hypothetical protein
VRLSGLVSSTSLPSPQPSPRRGEGARSALWLRVVRWLGQLKLRSLHPSALCSGGSQVGVVASRAGGLVSSTSLPSPRPSPRRGEGVRSRCGYAHAAGWAQQEQKLKQRRKPAATRFLWEARPSAKRRSGQPRSQKLRPRSGVPQEQSNEARRIDDRPCGGSATSISPSAARFTHPRAR